MYKLLTHINNFEVALNAKADHTDTILYGTTTIKGTISLLPNSVSTSSVVLGNVDDTSDANKPVSTAMQTQVDLKAPKQP